MMSGTGLNKIDFHVYEGAPDDHFLEALVVVYENLFHDARPAFFRQRLREKEDLLIIIAEEAETLVAFKIGYRYDENTFYSWVGGVLPEYRKKGIAGKLAKLQEDWARKKDYTALRTKSMNRFKPMMILNLKNGFDIKKVYTNESGQTKIIFEKKI